MEGATTTALPLFGRWKERRCVAPDPMRLALWERLSGGERPAAARGTRLAHHTYISVPGGAYGTICREEHFVSPCEVRLARSKSQYAVPPPPPYPLHPPLSGPLCPRACPRVGHAGRGYLPRRTGPATGTRGTPSPRPCLRLCCPLGTGTARTASPRPSPTPSGMQCTRRAHGDRPSL